MDWNKTWIGILLGLVLPVITYLIYYWLVVTFNLQRVNVSLCMVANLIPFYIVLNKEYYNSAKGILLSTVVLAILIASLTFFTNTLQIL
ncbi:MAG: hypothetical protein K0Q95_925 [Bacteroidota bacterium]|jgi:hypothetical protein|nr:hypothetical protein [Bacteroidota bacterium]